MKAFTIGFTRKSAEEFFGLLKAAGVRRVLDIRLRNTSHLAGWARKDDLEFFLRELLDVEYRHEVLLSPTPELLDDYLKRRVSWDEYEPRFRRIMAERRVEETLDRTSFDHPTALLCAEPTPERCHRRLVLEHLRQHWGPIEMVHL